MKIYAVYRGYYGEDFIGHSIRSVYDYVDKIFLCWTDRALGGASTCDYRGQTLAFPDPIDSLVEVARAAACEKFIPIYDHVENNENQFTHIVNDLILPFYERPDIIMIIEHDHIFRRDQLEGMLSVAGIVPIIGSKQIELWRTPKWRIPERNRTSTVFYSMNHFEKLPQTARQAEPVIMWPDIPKADYYVHNFGFCMSEKNMLWKHLIGLGISQKIKDSPPNPDWYEKTWLTWDFEKNNKNLEISLGHEHNISHAYPYYGRLPEVIEND